RSSRAGRGCASFPPTRSAASPRPGCSSASSTSERHAMRQPTALPLLVVLAATTAAFAGIIPGGGEPADDCLAQLDVAGAAGPPIVECTDCDPTCDRDGVSSPNGSCTFDVGLCLNQSLPGCTPGPLDRVHPSPRTALLVPALDSMVCGPP